MRKGEADEEEEEHHSALHVSLFRAFIWTFSDSPRPGKLLPATRRRILRGWDKDTAKFDAGEEIEIKHLKRQSDDLLRGSVVQPPTYSGYFLF